MSYPKRLLSPLSIIAIFVSLAQSVSAIALLQTTGNIQLSLTFFVILFPVGVAIGFFIILVRKHTVFYAPWEYGSEEEIRAFRGEPKPTDEGKFKEVLQRKVESAVPGNKNMVTQVMQKVEEAFLTIDTTTLMGKDGSSWVVLYEEFETVQELLDYIYWYIRDKVPVRSYGKKWLLKDASLGKRFEDMGSAYRKGLSGRDYRNLAQVGINPGMTLQVIPA